MEGTRHEKAVLVALAFFIGFCTSYLLFGLDLGQNKLNSTKQYIKNNDHQLVNREVASRQQVMVAPEVISKGSAAVAELVEGKLSIAKGDTVVQVWPPVATSSLDFDPNSSVLAFTSSLNGRYVYFCVEVVATDTCTSYIYSSEHGNYHELELTGSELAAELALHARWMSDGALALGNFRSSSSTAPWLME